jgi:hypothetical protein
MAEFINTIDALGDDAVIDGIIQKTIATFNDAEITEVGKYALNKCTALTEVNLPACTVIQQNVFQNCTALETFSAENVTKIYIYAFSGCTSLRNLHLPKLTECTGGNHYGVGHHFADCESLESVDFPLLKSCNISLFAGCKSLKEVNLPVLNTSAQNIFAGCASLEKICLPAQAYVNTGFFGNCTSLKLVDLPKANNFYNSAFEGCSVLTAVILRNTEVCVISGQWVFEKTPIKSGTGYIYVPRALVDSYKVATNWSVYANQFRALEDYTVDGTITGELDETKI